MTQIHLQRQSKGTMPETMKHVTRGAVTVFGVLYIYPVFVMLINAVKTPMEVARNPAALPSTVHLVNFVQAWRAAEFGRALSNSLVVTAMAVTLLVFTASLASYPLSRYRTRLNAVMYLLFVSMIMVPFQMAMIPLYRLIYGFGWISTFRAVVFVFVAVNTPFSVFLYTGFIQTVPFELEESARIDGAGALVIFLRIVFPLLRPVTSSVVILNSLAVWNEFLMPLLFLQDRSMRTIPVALFAFQGQYNTDWSMLFSALVLAMLPMLLVFLALQRHFISGITAGSIKG